MREGECHVASEYLQSLPCPITWRNNAGVHACRELAPVSAAALGACTLPVHSTHLALSSDEQLLAVCEPSTVSVYTIQGLAIHGLVGGFGRDPVAAWHLPDGATLKEVRSAKFCMAVQ